MIWLYIHLFIGILTFVIIWFAGLEASQRFKKRHPGLTIVKYSLVARLAGYFRLVILCLMPILNIIAFFTTFFKYDELIEETVRKEYLRCLREKEKEDGSEC